MLIGYGAVDELNRYAAMPGWTVHVPGHPDEVRHAVTAAVAHGDLAYVHVSARSNASSRDATGGLRLIRPGLDGSSCADGCGGRRGLVLTRARICAPTCAPSGVGYRARSAARVARVASRSVARGRLCGSLLRIAAMPQVSVSAERTRPPATAADSNRQAG